MGVGEGWCLLRAYAEVHGVRGACEARVMRCLAVQGDQPAKCAGDFYEVDVDRVNTLRAFNGDLQWVGFGSRGGHRVPQRLAAPVVYLSYEVHRLPSDATWWRCSGYDFGVFASGCLQAVDHPQSVFQYVRRAYHMMAIDPCGIIRL